MTTLPVQFILQMPSGDGQDYEKIVVQEDMYTSAIADQAAGGSSMTSVLHIGIGKIVKAFQEANMSVALNDIRLPRQGEKLREGERFLEGGIQAAVDLQQRREGLERRLRRNQISIHEADRKADEGFNLSKPFVPEAPNVAIALSDGGVMEILGSSGSVNVVLLDYQNIQGEADDNDGVTPADLDRHYKPIPTKGSKAEWDRMIATNRRGDMERYGREDEEVEP